MFRPSVCILAGSRRHDDPRIYQKEALTLREHGYEVCILCTDYEGVDRSGIRFIRLSALPDCKFRFRWVCLLMNHIHAALFRHRFAAAAKKTGAAYCHIHDSMLIPVGVRLRKHMKVIYDVHSGDPLFDSGCAAMESTAVSSEKGLRKAKNALSGFYALITADPSSLPELEELNRRVVPLWDYPRVRDYGTASRDSRRKKDKICMFGGIARSEVFPLLSAAKAANLSLVLSGEFEDEALQAECEALPEWQTVEYLDASEEAARRKNLSEARAGIVTSHGDASLLPSALFDFMASEVPVIVSNLASCSQIVDDANCGVCVDMSSSSEIAAALEYIQTNGDIAREMGKRGRSAVLKRYSWEEEEDRLFRLYPLPLESFEEDAPVLSAR